METLKQSELNKRIMRRVYFVFFLKKVLSPIAIKSYVSLVLLLGLITNVSVLNVFDNMFRKGLDFDGISYFSKYAFMHTEFGVQIIVSVSIIFVLYLLSSFSRNHLLSHKEV